MSFVSTCPPLAQTRPPAWGRSFVTNITYSLTYAPPVYISISLSPFPSAAGSIATAATTAAPPWVERRALRRRRFRRGAWSTSFAVPVPSSSRVRARPRSRRPHRVRVRHHEFCAQAGEGVLFTPPPPVPSLPSRRRPVLFADGGPYTSKLYIGFSPCRCHCHVEFSLLWSREYHAGHSSEQGGSLVGPLADSSSFVPDVPHSTATAVLTSES